MKSKVENILNRFDTIGLEEIREAGLMKRIDSKFIFHKETLAEIIEKLCDDYTILTIDNKNWFNYKSLYFDTENFDFYRQHHNGKIHRHKVRYRQYVDSNLSFLEVKERQNRIVSKTRIRTDELSEKLATKENSFVTNQLGKKATLFPKIWSDYRRFTLIAKNGQERVTFDTSLVFYNNEDSINFDNVAIAELKQARIDRNSVFYNVVKELRIRPFRISKYCVGVASLHTNSTIKRNNFKMKLIKLNQINNAN